MYFQLIMYNGSLLNPHSLKFEHCCKSNHAVVIRAWDRQILKPKADDITTHIWRLASLYITWGDCAGSCKARWKSLVSNRFLNSETSGGEWHPLLASVPWGHHAFLHAPGGLPVAAATWWEITCNSSSTHQQIKKMEFNRRKITEWYLEVWKALDQQHV